MALSTTQSIWRSGGGDQTRTAYCGSGLMAARFYVSNAAATGATVVVSSVAGAPALILPEGATVVSVAINDAGGGTIDLGTTGYTSGTTAGTIALALTASSVGTTSIGSVVTGSATTSMAYVTASSNAAGSGTVGGYLIYFVADPLVGQQNV